MTTEAPAAGTVIVVRGEPYDLPTDFTGRELMYLQQAAGVRFGELDHAANAGDVTVLLAITVVAMRRAGVEDASIESLADLRFNVEGADGIVVMRPSDDEPVGGGGRPTRTRRKKPATDPA